MNHIRWTTSVLCALSFVLQDNIAAAQTTEEQEELLTSAPSREEIPFIETLLIGPFKVWHVAGFIGCGLATILIAICCMVELRVPRTKEEIEANYEKRQAAHQYIDKLGKMEFTGLKLKSQALMQKERQQKKLEIQEQKEKKREQRKEANTAGGTGQLQNSNAFPRGYSPGMGGINPMMGGASGMMGGASGMMGGASGMRTGASPMMGGPNSMMGNMMAYHPSMMFGNPAMYGSLVNLPQASSQTSTVSGVPQGMMFGPQGMFQKAQSLSNLQKLSEENESVNVGDSTEGEKNTDLTSSKRGKFGSFVKGMIDEKKLTPSKKGAEMESEEIEESKAKLMQLVKKKWGKK